MRDDELLGAYSKKEFAGMILAKISS